MSNKVTPPYQQQPVTPAPGVPAWARAGLLLVGLLALLGGFLIINRAPPPGTISSQAIYSGLNPDVQTASTASSGPARSPAGLSAVPASTVAPPECFAAVNNSATEVQSCVNNAAPAGDGLVTVFGRLLVNGQPVSGLTMETSWDHKYLNGACSATTDGRGVARCSRNISGATRGYTVVITVKFKYNGRTYTGETSFTPAR